MHHPLGHMSTSRQPALQVASTERAMELGKEAAEYVSKTFVKPIKLEFEKVCSARSAGLGFRILVGRSLRLCRSSSYAVSRHPGRRGWRAAICHPD